MKRYIIQTLVRIWGWLLVALVVLAFAYPAIVSGIAWGISLVTVGLGLLVTYVGGSRRHFRD